MFDKTSNSISVPFLRHAAVVFLTVFGLIAANPVQAQSAPGALLASGSTGASVHDLTLQPLGTSLHLRESRQFSAAAQTSPAPNDLTWAVNGVTGGNAEIGTISQDGLYTAPSALPQHYTVTITAHSVARQDLAASTSVNLASGVAVYVSTTGNNNNPGTLAAPWRTIQYAAANVQAGDIVNVRGGVYNEAVTMQKSGSASNGPITFQSYPGELATVDGTGLKTVGGQSGLFTIDNQSYIVISGFEVRNFTSSSDASVPVGIYLEGADAYVQLLHNHVHNITTTAKATASNCASDALAIAVYGSSAPASINYLTIDGNEVDHNETGCSETVTLNGNVENFTVTGNLIHDNNNIGIDAIGFEKVSPQVAYDQARNGVISGNTIYNITSYGNPDYGKQYAADGIYVDGGTNIVIERNTVHNADLNVELASEHSGRLTSYITVRNNLIYDGNSNGISIGGYDSKRGGTDRCTIVNNTLYNNDTKRTGSGEVQIQYYATNNVFENNIVYAGAQNLFFNNYTSSESNPAAADDNLYFSSNAANANWIWNGTSYTGFASYRAATKEDAQSYFADPEFLSTSTPNFQIESTSPAVNKGIDMGTAVVGTLDLAGDARVQSSSIDIGAYQH